MNDNLRYTVIGAGNGGKAMAAHMALMGKEVTLYNRTFANIEVIAERGGIDLDNPGGISGFGKLVKVTDQIGDALEGAHVIMVVVPSSGHRDIAAAAAPYLRDGQIVLLHPGRTCGAIEFAQVLLENNCPGKPIVAEAETFIYASRSEGPSHARIFRIKESVPLAALPATKNRAVLDAIHHVYPQYIDGGNVLKTGLNNMGAVFHPTITLLNAGWIETTHGDFEFYIDGVSPSVAKLLETVDRERCTVASSVGIRARTGLEWLAMAYDARGENLHEAIHNQSGYYGIKAPPTLNHRYIFEEIPMSLVPIAALGQRYGVSVRGIDAIIKLACIIHNTDYWRKGRTLEKLGIKDLSVEELTHYVETGERE